MESLRLLVATSLVLASSTSAGAVPIFAQNEINEQVARIDVAGVHFGDTQEQVRATMRRDGWTLTLAEMLGESFRDKVGWEVSKRRGVRFVAKDPKLPSVDEYRKGAQKLTVEYRPHSGGNLALTIRYDHANAESGSLREAYFRKIEEKFSATPFVRVKYNLFCLPSDARCFRSADPEDGGVLSDYPSVFLNGSMVILHGGEQGDKAFSKDFEAAVTKQSGGLDDVSL